MIREIITAKAEATFLWLEDNAMEYDLDAVRKAISNEPEVEVLMRILIAPDKFKGSLGAEEVAERIRAGVRSALPTAEIEMLPLADGGEGTAETIRRARGGEWVSCATHDALGREIHARYAWMAQSSLAVLEMSAAAGSPVTPP